jgi:hypothetical protein
MNREVHNEQEVLDKDEQAVSGLVAGLKSVEAPANFERRVMVKIAEGQPRRSRSLFALPSIAYAVPALLVLLIATFVVFKLSKPDAARPEPNVTAGTSRPAETKPSFVPTPVPEPTTVALEQPPITPNPPSGNNKQKPLMASTVSNSNRGGSYDETVREKKRPNPEGIEPNSPSSANRDDVMTSSSIPVSQVFDMLGISVETGDAWRVSKVRENGAADKSGVKAGDVITAFDDHDINAGSGSINFGSISKITVRRDGKLIPLRVVIP